MKQTTNKPRRSNLVVDLPQITGKGKKRTMENTRILVGNFQGLLKQSMEGLKHQPDTNEKPEWRWFLNVSTVNSSIAGHVLNELGIRYTIAQPEFPDIKNPTYDVSSYSLVGYQVSCGLAEYECLRELGKIMQPYFVILKKKNNKYLFGFTFYPHP